MARTQGVPLIVELAPMPQSIPLARLDFKKAVGGDYDEIWLQRLVHQHAEVLPINAIEPAFWPAIPVCMEMPLESGFLDNLLVTPNGHLVAVECKLWRNPEAQRKVLAQIIDYAKDLQRLTYESFENAIRNARREPDFDLYRFATESDLASLDEAAFVDSVSRNLRLGRCLLLIVGDGVRENLISMADLLQQHAGLHFCLALVELAVYEIPESNRRLVVPSVPAKTMNIIRGIVDVRDGRPIVTAPSSVERATTLTGAEFFDELERSSPGASTSIKTFLDSCADLQILWEVKKTLRVRMAVGAQKVLPIVIYPNGNVETSFPNPKKLMRGFAERLAEAIPDAVTKQTEKTIFVKKRNGSYVTIQELIEHQGGVRAAFERLNADLSRSLDDDSSTYLDDSEPEVADFSP